MILVTGPVASGKRTFARGLGFADGDMTATLGDACPVVFDAHELVREPADDGQADILHALAAKDVVIATDVGAGIVPMDAGERAWRERAGRLTCDLAARAHTVVRMTCGIPTVVKGSLDDAKAACARRGASPLDEIEFVIVRHGQTPGNALRRYVGALDQPLSEEGRAQARAAGSCPAEKLVYVSTLKRTHETASLLFPNAEQVVVDDIQEMDFGAFAGRSADDMADDDDYRAWVDGMCLGRCPGGEARGEFTERVCRGVEGLLRRAAARGEKRVVLVAHGGTMMASLSRFADDGRSYYEWLVGNCEGYRLRVALDGDVPAFEVQAKGPLGTILAE